MNQRSLEETNSVRAMHGLSPVKPAMQIINAETRRRLQPYTIEELKTLPKREPLIKGYLDARGMSVMYGESNCGKSFLALDMAMHIAMGRPWNGKRVKQGEVVYIAAEGGMGIAERLQAFIQHRQLDQAPAVNLIPCGIDLCQADADTTEIIKECHILDDVQLVVVDTLSRALAGGNENAPDDMGALIRHCDLIRQQTGAHVLIIHHAGKDTTKGGRGHSSLRAAVDTELEVVKDAGGTITLEIKKQRDGKTGDVLSFTLEQVKLGVDEDGDPLTSCVVKPTENAPASSKLSGYVRDAYHILLEKMGTNDHVPTDEWIDAVKDDWGQAGTSGDTIKKRITRMKSELVSDGIIRIIRDCVYLGRT